MTTFITSFIKRLTLHASNRKLSIPLFDDELTKELDPYYISSMSSSPSSPSSLSSLLSTPLLGVHQ
nr:12801_t:CDS:2 [Entrophospora candida]